MKKLLLITIEILLFILEAIFLELNKNTIIGWILFVTLIGSFIYFSTKSDHKILLILSSIVIYLLIVFISFPPYKNVPAVKNTNPDKTEILNIKNGPIQGVFNEDHSVEVYAGIPYAKPPVGDLRWKEPQNPENWNEVLVADHFAPMSYQAQNLPAYNSLVRIIGFHDYQISLKDNYREKMSEDSLYLNIFKPSGNKKDLPVVVFIHGGTLKSGQSYTKDYNGEEMAKQDIIMVTITYRLGIFGYYADENLIKESPNNTTGNYGLLDQIKALEWVQNNIEYFGGDKNNVTIAGESAGSASVSALCVSPLAEGLFNKAIMESSTLTSITPPHSYRDLSVSLNRCEKIRNELGVSDLQELRNIPAKDLVKYSETEHYMVNDGYALKEAPYNSYMKGIHHETAILHGYNSEESAPFIMFDHAKLNDYENRIRYYFEDYTDEVLKIYPAENDQEADQNWAEIYGAVFFSYPHYCLNRLALKNNIPVYEYFFSRHNGSLGPWHSGEMIYAYHNIPDGVKIYDDTDRKLSDQMFKYWVSFIRNGNPNNSENINWPINTDSKTLLQFDENVALTDERSLKLYEIMDELYGWKDPVQE